MEMNQAAREANKRLDAQRDIWRAGEPTRDMHETLKDIKLLLRDILEILQNNKK
jgi:hypothetical protein